MERTVVLLRGVNVANRRVSMSVLRDGLAGAGCEDIVTYVQSGNIVLTPPSSQREVVSAWLEQVIGDLAGFEVPVVLRTSTELREVVDRNPYPEAGGTRLHVAFYSDAPSDDLLDGIDIATHAPERCTQIDRELYFDLPNGMGRAKLPVLVERVGRRTAQAIPTFRNWNTVLKLVELSGSGDV